MTKQERIEKQKQRLAEMKAPEAALHRQGFRYIAGVDEVGRGPLAGPVVTAAVVLPEDFDVLGVDDSKKLSEKRREELYNQILDKCVAWGIGMMDHKVIDEINILQATKAAMRQAIGNCDAMLAERCGGAAGTREASAHENAAHESAARIEYVIFDAVKIEDLGRPQEAIIKGDAKVLAIAAASIVAKVTRDRYMRRMAEEYPEYGFASHKGYGSGAHIEALKKYGPCEIHRRSFIGGILLNE